MSDPTQDLRDSFVPHDEWATFVGIKRVFTPDQCARIVALGGETKRATIDGGRIEPRRRDGRVAWIGQSEETSWLFEQLRKRLDAVNNRFFHLKLAGFTEPLQLGCYGPEDHYGWHLDIGRGENRIRKLSFVVQLSDPEDYDGGVLQITTDGRPTAMLHEQGAMIAFPAFILHRVTPVMRGLRRSLVGWIGGPPFA
ncbi:2OG-Fe(II) oxygenase [Pelagibius marinus]|uniref:2OG-Fe(II) oxygenase n=1 Tax=Pelagibius marinus TaxID=2762760 RepID=UPI0018733CD6|nr:2OG-Fe(II) oxygenase [Pelagibius marinus]